MASKILYNPTKDAVTHPCKGATFFPDGPPASDDVLCAELARLVYCKFDRDGTARQKVEEVLNGAGFPRCIFFAKSGTQGFLAIGAATAVLAFRGTELEDPTDIITDIRILRKAWEGGGKVHIGFRDAFLLVRPQVEAALNGVTQRLLITGHSLGAALATLAATLYKPAGLITIGSPLIGDKKFAQSKNLAEVTIRRYVDCCDLVCVIPPKLLGYEHVAPKHYVDRNGKIHFKPGAQEVKADQQKAREDYLRKHAFIVGNAPLRDIADHAPINYISALTGRA